MVGKGIGVDKHSHPVERKEEREFLSLAIFKIGH
jgi:hypothetical protein